MISENYLSSHDFQDSKLLRSCLAASSDIWGHLGQLGPA